MLPDPLSSGPPGSYSAGGDRAHEELAGTPLMGAGASDLMTSVLTAAKLRRCGPRAGRPWGVPGRACCGLGSGASWMGPFATRGSDITPGKEISCGRGGQPHLLIIQGP